MPKHYPCVAYYGQKCQGRKSCVGGASPHPQYIEKNGQKYSRTDSGKWRPMTTHKTVCPSEGLWRNVAILADNGPIGLRLNCEVCGYLWLYKAETAEYPLLEGASGENTRQVFSAAGNSGYTNPERSR